MGVGKLTTPMFLRKKWFFRFIPAPGIKQYQVFAYKVSAIEPGAGYITFRRLRDGKAKKITTQQAQKYLLTQDECIPFAKNNGFDCIWADSDVLLFLKRK